MNKKITLFVAILYCNAVRCTFIENLGNLNAQLQNVAKRPFLSQLEISKDVYILDETINKNAPSKAQLEGFAQATGIEVVQLVVAWQDLSVETFTAQTRVIDPITGQLNTLLGFTKSLESCMDSNAIHVSDKETQSGINKLSNNKLKSIIEKNKKGTTNEFLSASLGGGYASCGYHTVLHLQTLRDALKEAPEKRGTILTKLTSLWEVNDKFGLKIVVDALNSMLLSVPGPSQPLRAQWRNEIKKMSEAASADGEWLKFEGMNYLSAQYLEDKSGTHSFVFYDQSAEGEVAHGKEESLPKKVEASNANSVYENYWSAKEYYKEHNTPTRLAFLVNTRRAHWYGIFITTRTDPYLAIIVDSKNSPRYNHGPLKEILVGIFSESVHDKIIQNACGTYFAQKANLPSTKEEDQIEDLETLIALAPAADKELTQSIYTAMLARGDYANLMLTTFSVFAPLREFFNKKFDTQGGSRLVELFQEYRAGGIHANNTALLDSLAEHHDLYSLFTLLAEEPPGSI